MSNQEPGLVRPEYGTRPPGQTLPRVGGSAGGPSASAAPEPKSKRRRGAKPSRDAASRGVKSKVINTQKMAAIALAVVVAVLVVLLATASSAETYVVRINSSVPALSAVSPAQIEAISLPDSAIEPGAISAATAEEALEEALALIDTGRMRQYTPAGRQLHPEDISIEGDLTVPLGPGERLISVNAAVAASIGGQLRPGDTVDVIALAQISQDNVDVNGNAILDGRVSGTVARVVASNVEIVNVFPGEQTFDAAAQTQTGNRDKTVDEILPENPVPGIYVLRVTGEEAVVLGLTNLEADLFLTLRGGAAADPIDPFQPITLESILGIPAS